jgi:hypothetical protein
VKRTLTDFLGNELLFEHLRTIYRYHLDTGGYDRNEMVAELAAHLESPEVAKQLAAELSPEDAELLYVLRQVGGIAPRRWLFGELVSRGRGSAEQWERTFLGLRSRHITFLIGSDIAYLPEGMGEVFGRRIIGQPKRRKSEVVPGSSALRQSVHGLAVAVLNHIHQNPPRVMAEEEKIWKRDLEGMGDFFHPYLYEPGEGAGSVGLIRGRISRLIELFRKMGFLEKRGKRLYLDAENWTDWASRREVERQSLFLSFLKDNYENIPIALEALVDWKGAAWIPLESLTEAVRYRALRSSFHVLRIRPQADVSVEGPTSRWVSACVHLLADLGLVYTGKDPQGEPVAAAVDSAIEAWRLLHTSKTIRRRRRERERLRAYAQPNFELLIPEECSPEMHRRIGAIAELKSLDRFWTYTLTPHSVARGVEEGLTADEILQLLDSLVEGELPSNVRDAVRGWGQTAWWVDADGDGTFLRAEKTLFETIAAADGFDERFERENSWLRPVTNRAAAERWLEEQGFRVAGEDSDPPGEFGRSVRGEYARALEAWQRRVEHGGEGTPPGSYWDDVVPVEPLPESRPT